MARFLQFDRVSFAYPGMAEPLLADVTAHFPEGTWTGIVGANGAGKTTILRLAAGEISPSGGTWVKLPLRGRGRIGYTFCATEQGANA